MPISFNCPYCGKQTNVADKYAGQSGPCAGCGQTITIPGATAGAPAVGLPPPPDKSSSGSTVLVIVLAVCLVGALGCGGILVALLLPAVQSAREAARRSQCSNNLKQIALAFHNYHDTYKCFPPAYIPDQDGKPMHSWRVLILPFLEQSPLHHQYNFNEPWDSPSNLAVVNAIVPTYTCPSASGQPASSETNYMVVTGPGTVFEGDKACSISTITDGTSNTIMVVEVTGTGVSWAEPKDLDASTITFPLSGGGPASTGSRHPGGINVAFCDSSVRYISDTISQQLFNLLLTKSDGQAVSGGDF